MPQNSTNSRFDSVYLTNVALKTDDHTYIPNEEINLCLPVLSAVGLYSYLQCTFRNQPINYEVLRKHFINSKRKVDIALEHLLSVGLLTKRI